MARSRIHQSAIHPVVHKNLRGASVGRSKRESDGRSRVGTNNWIIRYTLPRPRLTDRWIAVDAPLHDEAIDHAEEAIAVVETVAHEIVEPVGSTRRPLTNNLYEKVAATGFEGNEGIGSYGLESAVTGTGEQGGANRRFGRTARSVGARADDGEPQTNREQCSHAGPASPLSGP